ncbi:MAG TPA: transcriptional regulator [Clostridiales bacterium UBA8960]|nr:transcriptional regulator [Clostridiales bacterium UBA8960]
MSDQILKPGLTSISVIVGIDIGHKVIKISKENGAIGCTALICRGTVTNKWLELLDLNEDRRELIFILCENHVARCILEALNRKLKFEKPNHGIAFSTEIAEVRGMHSLKDALEEAKVNYRMGEDLDLCKPEKEGEKMYHSIYVVVDKGKANDVVSIAKKAGARGGTIFNARGSGIHETSKLFSMEVEPEKEVVLILTEAKLTDAVAGAIVDGMELEKPGNGVLYIQNVSMTYGIY